MTIWLYMLAAVCGIGSALILATVLAMLVPLGLWPTLAGLSVFMAGVGLASAVWAIRYDLLSRAMMTWHMAQLEGLKGQVPEMLKGIFRKLQADGVIPEGFEMEVKDTAPDAPGQPDQPNPNKKLN